MPRERDKRYVQVEGTTATWPPAGGGTLWGPFTLAAAEVIQAAAGTNNIVTVTIDADVYTVG